MSQANLNLYSGNQNTASTYNGIPNLNLKEANMTLFRILKHADLKLTPKTLTIIKKF